MTFPFKPTCCDNPLILNAIDDDGRVYATGASVAWVAPLNRIAGVKTIQGLHRHYIQSVAGDGSILATGNGPTAVVGRLRSGVFVESQTRVGATGGSSSADGRSLAYVDREGILQVRDLTSGDVQAMPSPTGSRFGSIAWQDATTVLLATEVTETGRRTVWVRCSLNDLRCEIAALAGRRYTFPS